MNYIESIGSFEDFEGPYIIWIHMVGVLRELVEDGTEPA
jgi:hypothetical protein